MPDNENIHYSLIITIVNRGYADAVIDGAREAGARGGTVLYARGTGIHETERFMNISIQPEKELVLTLVKKTAVEEITEAIVEAAGLMTKGRGICFTLPVTDMVGIISSDPQKGFIEEFEETEE